MEVGVAEISRFIEIPDRPTRSMMPSFTSDAAICVLKKPLVRSLASSHDEGFRPTESSSVPSPFATPIDGLVIVPPVCRRFRACDKDRVLWVQSPLEFLIGS